MRNDKKNRVRDTGISRSELRNRKKVKMKWSTPLRIVLIVVLSIVLIGAVAGAKILADATNVANNSYQPRKVESTINGQDLSKMNEAINPIKDPISILIMGVDDNEDRNLGSSRTDTLLLLTINPQKDKITMTSIPRDTYAYINTNNYQGMDKINAAYTHGGDDGAIQAVQDLLEVPINYYLTIDFKAFEEIIDALGGIEVDVPMDINESYASDNSGKTLVNKGVQTLDGQKALMYARIRKVDNDIERGKRQQNVIQKVIEKATNVGSLTKYNKVLAALDGHIWTDMTTDTMISLIQTGISNSYTFDSLNFSWMSFHYNEESFVGLYEDSLEYVSHKFKVSLNLEEENYQDEPDYVFESNHMVSNKTYPDYGAVDD